MILDPIFCVDVELFFKLKPSVRLEHTEYANVLPTKSFIQKCHNIFVLDNTFSNRFKTFKVFKQYTESIKNYHTI